MEAVDKNMAVPPWPKLTYEVELELMAGNAQAVEMIRLVAAISHIYDDLIDKDADVPAEQIHNLMRMLWIDLPMNPFFREYEGSFRPLLLTGLLNWRAANAMEDSGCTEELRIAHCIRYSLGDVALLAMALCGGHEHAAQNARRCRLMLQQDTWEHYQQEHSARTA